MQFRSPGQQEDFLKHRCFGEGKRSAAKVRVPILVKIGLALIGMALATMATTAIWAELARERGQWYLVGSFFEMAALLFGIIGAGFCRLRC